MIVKVVYPREALTVIEATKRADLKKAEKGGADLAPVDYEFLKAMEKKELGEKRTVIIHCDSINYTESKTGWRIICYMDARVIREKSFDMGDRVKVYIIEEGKTVDTLPRR